MNTTLHVAAREAANRRGSASAAGFARRLSLAVLLAFAPGAPAALAAGELVKNGLLTQGEAGQPTAWKTEAYDTKPGATDFGWAVDDAGIGTLAIASARPNDARWVQIVPISPSTWYRVSGWIRTEDVGTENIGAYLSVMDTFYNSAEIRGTQPWQPVMLWVKSGAIDTQLKVSCRLGGYGALNRGSAWCTGISVEAAGTPATGTAYVFGGSPDEPDAGGRLPWARAGAVLVVAGVALLLWRYLRPPRAGDPE